MRCCSEKTERLFADMQKIWCSEIINRPDKDFVNLYTHNFEEEWTLGDYEQSPFNQIIWGILLVDGLNKKYKTDTFEFRINRYYLIVKNENHRWRFLFDVMNNPNYNYGPYYYHLIGNYAPIPGNVPLKRSLQFIHRDKGEKWDLFLEYLQNNWTNFDMVFSFDEYITLTYQNEYFSGGKPKELRNSEQIKSLIETRGKKITDQFLELRKSVLKRYINRSVSSTS